MLVWHCFNEEKYWRFVPGEPDLCPICGDFRELIDVNNVELEQDDDAR